MGEWIAENIQKVVMTYGKYFEEFSLRDLLLHPAIWLLLATSVLIFGATHLWDQYRYQIASPEKYTITRGNTSINAPPDWFEADLYQELHDHVFNSSTLLDQHVVVQTAAYLNSVDWVQNVDRIAKNPIGLNIQLSYRDPVAFVVNRSGSQTMVDADGVVFDERLLTNLDTNRLDNDLLRISMPRIDMTPIQPWNASADERVAHAANLCQFLIPHAAELRLYRVVTFDLPSFQLSSGPEFQIWTRNGVRVLWGHAPGTEVQSEADPSKKLQAIHAFANHHGPLESFQGNDRQMIDVSTGVARLVPIKRFARLEDIHNGVIK